MWKMTRISPGSSLWGFVKVQYRREAFGVNWRMQRIESPSERSRPVVLYSGHTSETFGSFTKQ
jgi:hypothetical protein